MVAKTIEEEIFSQTCRLIVCGTKSQSSLTQDVLTFISCE